MKKTGVNNYIDKDRQSIRTIPKNYYCVPVGNNQRVYVKSKKMAARFLANYNQFLSEKLYQLNDLYCSQFCFYRSVFFQISLENVQKIEGIEKALNFQFNRALLRKYGETIDGNHFICHHVTKIMELLQEFQRVLVEIYPFERFTSQKYKAMHLQKQLEWIRKEINGFVPEFEKENGISVIMPELY